MERALPYKAIDTILSLEEARIVTLLELSDKELFNGHFPFLSIFPGVFIMEMVEQTAHCYFDGISKQNDQVYTLNSINSTRFYSPVKPGDELKCSCDVKFMAEGKYKVSAVCSVSEEKVAKLDLEFHKKGNSCDELFANKKTSAS